MSEPLTTPADIPESPARARLSSGAVSRMIRVDQAGEYGATRIYAGQLAVMGTRTPAARAIARMAAQEQRHRERFDAVLIGRGVRPTALQPFWNIAGFGLGVVTALIGPRAAMACTEAVETEIEAHYNQQLEELGDAEPELTGMIAEFRDEEVEHREAAVAAGAHDAPAYPLLTGLIRLGCRFAIATAKRI